MTDILISKWTMFLPNFFFYLIFAHFYVSQLTVLAKTVS